MTPESEYRLVLLVVCTCWRFFLGLVGLVCAPFGHAIFLYVLVVVELCAVYLVLRCK